MIKEAITDAHQRGLGELDTKLDSRPVLQALYGLLSRQEAIAKIKDLILKTGVMIHKHWIRAHVVHTYNERVLVLA